MPTYSCTVANLKFCFAVKWTSPLPTLHLSAFCAPPCPVPTSLCKTFRHLILLTILTVDPTALALTFPTCRFRVTPTCFYPPNWHPLPMQVLVQWWLLIHPLLIRRCRTRARLLLARLQWSSPVLTLSKYRLSIEYCVVSPHSTLLVATNAAFPPRATSSNVKQFPRCCQGNSVRGSP